MDDTECPVVKVVMDTEEEESRRSNKARKCCRHGPKAWCRKYWWEGQDLRDSQATEMLLEDQPYHKQIMNRYRRIIGFFLPAAFFHVFWWPYFFRHNTWHWFVDKYPMAIAMIFGAMVAGMTSEGGGAIAFPVMTLALQIKPSIARDFSAMIQSCGMTSAAFTIFFMRVRIEWHSIVCCSIGGTGGVIFGLHVVDPALSPQVKKLGFVSIWFAFASVLVFLNRVSKRRTFKKIEDFNWWKCVVLLVVGFVGGIFTSFSGSGLDICSFMILTLLFRVSEKIATPTSVILMAFNTLVTFYWRWAMQNEISQDAWEYLGVCIPIVVMFAPIGSVLGSHFHRLILAGLVIVLDTVALISGFAIVRPLPLSLVGGCIVVIVGCFALFMGLTYAGQKLMERYEAREKAAQVMNKFGQEMLDNGSCISDASSKSDDSQRRDTLASSSIPE